MIEIEQSLIIKYQKMYHNGVATEVIIEQMYNDGLGVMQSIRAARNLFSISLGDAKTIVTSHKSFNALAKKLSLPDEVIDKLIE